MKTKLYKNQGIHAISAIFTVEDGITKVLLIKRKNSPGKGEWILTGGSIYNNEDVDEGVKREIFEKTGIENIKLEQFEVFGKHDRAYSDVRMVAICYIGVIDGAKVSLLRETLNTSNCDWFAIDKTPKLGFDHDEILKSALKKLQELILTTNILKALFPEKFTFPELQKTYESILNKHFDRRNFRKKFNTLNLIEETGDFKEKSGSKPTKLYRFKNTIYEKNVF